MQTVTKKSIVQSPPSTPATPVIGLLPGLVAVG